MPSREVTFTAGGRVRGVRYLAETFMALEAKEKFQVEPTEKIDEYLESVTGVVKVLRYGLEGYALAHGTGEKPTIADAQAIFNELGKTQVQKHCVHAIIAALIPGPEDLPDGGEGRCRGPSPSAARRERERRRLRLNHWDDLILDGMRAGLSYPALLRLTPREIALADQAAKEREEAEHRLRLVEGYKLLSLERSQHPSSLATFLDGKIRIVTDPEEKARLAEEHARRAAATALPGDAPPLEE